MCRWASGRPRPVAAAMKLLQASGFTRVVQPAITLESVAKFIMVGVWVLFQPILDRGDISASFQIDKVGTLLAAMRRPSG